MILLTRHARCRGDAHPTLSTPSVTLSARARGNDRFGAQNKFKLVYLFDLSHLCHSGLNLGKFGKRQSTGTFLCNYHPPFVPH